MRRSYKKCPRCKQAIHVDVYEQHSNEMNCLIAKPESEANRCPLCGTDTGPGVIGWKRHLVYEGCPNNERTA